MINANELRKGNLVDFNGEVAKVSQLLELEVVFKCGDSELYENLKGVLLTEEWLLKFGFKEVDDSFVFPNMKSNIYLSDNCDGIEIDGAVTGDYDCCVYFKIPKYVHQLQNLYFALTGNELKIVESERS